MPTGIRFPNGLAPPEPGGYGSTVYTGQSRTEMEIGAARVRNRRRAAPRFYEVSWRFTQEDYRRFDLWFQNSIQGGSRQFDIQLLDDDDELTWFTANWVPGTFEAAIDSSRYEWNVRGIVRVLGDTFGTTRPAGTDELYGDAAVTLTATGALLIGTALYGGADLGLTAVTRFAPTLFGDSTPGLTAVARFTALPFYGDSALDLTATGRLFIDPLTDAADNDQPCILLRFPTSGDEYDPPAGDDVYIVMTTVGDYNAPPASGCEL